MSHFLTKNPTFSKILSHFLLLTGWYTNSTANFIGNSGEEGGAISLYSMSVLTVVSDVHCIFNQQSSEGWSIIRR